MTVLKSLTDMKISAVGEKYVTSSRVIPNLDSSKRHVEDMFASSPTDSSATRIVDMLAVKQWKPI